MNKYENIKNPIDKAKEKAVYGDILEIWLHTEGTWCESKRNDFERRLLVENTEHTYLSVLDFAKRIYKTDDIYKVIVKITK